MVLRHSSRVGLTVAALAAILPCCAPMRAADWTDKISLHAYGGWAAGTSDPYPFLAGRGEGEAEVENLEAVLLFQFRPTEHLLIVIAPEGEVEREGNETEDKVRLELAYAEWETSERFRIRFGRNRLPFGIYTDIYDVGTLRPFYHLPVSIYGHSGFVSESYLGVGIGGLAPAKKGWELRYDLFAGGADFDVDEPFEEALETPGGEGDAGEEAEGDIESLIGGRLILGTPVDGLTFGVSAFSGKPEAAGDFATSEPQWGDFRSVGVHVEFQRGAWTTRAETGRHHEDEFDTDASYLEVSRRLGERWQVALRGEHATVDFSDELPTGGDSLLDHDEIAAGISYWFDSGFVLKLSIHSFDGNLFAHPHDRVAEALSEGSLDDSGTAVVFGAQFSY